MTYELIRIAVCDDSIDFLKQTKSFLESNQNETPKYSVFAFDNFEDLIRSHYETPFDIIFLDILMPPANGIEVAREIRKQDQKVKLVFLTSSKNYAFESYSVKANNYLLKPVDQNVLSACLNELIEDICKNEKYISVRSYDTVYRVALSDIAYVEAQNKHVLISLRKGSEVISTEPLYSFEEKLTFEEGFYKCHRSYIVNMYCIDTYSPNEVTMNSNVKIPISRNLRKEFSNTYFNIVFGKE